MPMTAEEIEKENEVEPERIIIREDSMQKNKPTPFFQALRGKKKITKHINLGGAKASESKYPTV